MTQFFFSDRPDGKFPDRVKTRILVRLVFNAWFASRRSCRHTPFPRGPCLRQDVYRKRFGYRLPDLYWYIAYTVSQIHTGCPIYPVQWIPDGGQGEGETSPARTPLKSGKKRTKKIYKLIQRSLLFLPVLSCCNRSRGRDNGGTACSYPVLRHRKRLCRTLF